MNLNELVNKAHTNAKEKGFWDKPRETGTLIALIHSEVTEALDAETCANFCEELADICIRIFDLCGGLEIDLEKVLSAIAENDEVATNIYIDTTSITAIEDSFLAIDLDFDDNKFACDVHRYLSYALEGDRKGDKEQLGLSIGLALLNTVAWAVCKGYRIESNIINKMEFNSKRPRLHGKRY